MPSPSPCSIVRDAGLKPVRAGRTGRNRAGVALGVGIRCPIRAVDARVGMAVRATRRPRFPGDGGSGRFSRTSRRTAFSGNDTVAGSSCVSHVSVVIALPSTPYRHRPACPGDLSRHPAVTSGRHNKMTPHGTYFEVPRNSTPHGVQPRSRSLSPQSEYPLSIVRRYGYAPHAIICSGETTDAGPDHARRRSDDGKPLLRPGAGLDEKGLPHSRGHRSRPSRHQPGFSCHHRHRLPGGNPVPQHRQRSGARPRQCPEPDRRRQSGFRCGFCTDLSAGPPG